MRARPRAADPGTSWDAYRPDEQAPWDLARVVHLHRCAGFGAPWGVLERDLREGVGPSVDRLLRGAPTAGAGRFEELAAKAADLAVATGDAGRLKAWWVYRMLYGPDPLGERLTLVWHNHFATSQAKVRDLALLRRQNDLFRTRARGKFGDLLEAAARDPALLIWLDAPSNRAEHPNENLARELMELFTIGLGHFTESDVKQAARALTGWTVRDGAFAEDPGEHDDGEKVLLGRRGRWSGGDLLGMLAEHPATSTRLAWRLCDAFLGEGAAGADDVAALAEGLRGHGLDVAWGVETVLRSRLFFAGANLGRRVLSPAEYVVGAARVLELDDPPPSTIALAEEVALMGQDLFHPPNVGGWPGGRGWLEPRALVRRANFAAALTGGRLPGQDRPFDAQALAARHGQPHEGFVEQVLLGTTRRPPRERPAASLLASPEAQSF